MINQWLWLIPVLPWLASLWIAIGLLFGFYRGERSEKQTSTIMLACCFGSLVLVSIVGLIALVDYKTPGIIEFGTWFSSGEIHIKLNLLLDSLSLRLAFVVALISFLTLRFSINYLHREAGFHRFFMILGIFNGAMLLIVLSGNAMLTFVGWELAAISSYLLIAYAYEQPTASRNATRVLITNRIGDIGFILAITFSLLWMNSVDWNIVNRAGQSLGGLNVALIAAAFLLAALVKSALVPFSPWISRALEGPTPSSALFYGSLMVHAGVYLIIRLYPLFAHSPAMSIALLVFGVITALYGFLSGLVQTDVKSSLLFSTTGQIGLMFISVSFGWLEVAIWHLLLHTIWRAYHFLSAPAMIRLMTQRTRPVPQWLKNRRWLYTACLQRFWLDNLAHSLLIRPTVKMANDIQHFDEEVVNRIAGLPTSIGEFSSLMQWEQYKGENGNRLIGDTGDIGRGRGALGKMMQWLASGFNWFEEHLLMKGGDKGMMSLIQQIGKHLTKIERLLSQPRYLILMVLVTFIVIL